MWENNKGAGEGESTVLGVRALRLSCSRPWSITRGSCMKHLFSREDRLRLLCIMIILSFIIYMKTFSRLGRAIRLT